MDNKIIGRNPVSEALKSGVNIEKIMIKKGKQEGSIIPLIRKAKDKGIFVQEVDKNKLDVLSDGENHQGIIAVVCEYSYSTVSEILAEAKEKEEEPFVIICDKIQDPHNLGAIIRTSACVGAHGVIIPKRNSATLNSVVAKTSAGALMHMKVAQVTNISECIRDLKDQGLWIAGADMDGADMYSSNLTGALGLVIGNEGEGISRLVKENCDFLVSIPMTGKISSLNASVAGAVLMYEAIRQRKK